MTQNAGSNKKYPSSGSWHYKEVMRELARQSSKKRIVVQVGDQIYESIREFNTDICDIAQNLGSKADNIKNVKYYVFIMSTILTGMVLIKLNVNNLILIFNKP